MPNNTSSLIFHFGICISLGRFPFHLWHTGSLNLFSWLFFNIFKCSGCLLFDRLLLLYCDRILLLCL